MFQRESRIPKVGPEQRVAALDAEGESWYQITRTKLAATQTLPIHIGLAWLDSMSQIRSCPNSLWACVEDRQNAHFFYDIETSIPDTKFGTSANQPTLLPC